MEESPDYYGEDKHSSVDPPFPFTFVEAGPRLGWRWGTDNDLLRHTCEINWLDPEPNKDSDAYVEYARELQSLNQSVDFYRGFFKPPMEEEYRRLCRQ